MSDIRNYFAGGNRGSNYNNNSNRSSNDNNNNNNYNQNNNQNINQNININDRRRQYRCKDEYVTLSELRTWPQYVEEGKRESPLTDVVLFFFFHTTIT